jgi:hypothetical protein
LYAGLTEWNQSGRSKVNRSISDAMARENMRYRRLIICLSIIVAQAWLPALADEKNHVDRAGQTRPAVLTENGNDAFGTLREVVAKLQADPDTDWRKVDLESLRQHLIDMDNFTNHVSVMGKRNVDNGVEVIVTADNERAHQSLRRVLAAHPRMLKLETGWDMVVARQGKQWRLTITSVHRKDAERIRGLGYIGIMTLGDHHPVHHWAMATGANPHAH